MWQLKMILSFHDGLIENQDLRQKQTVSFIVTQPNNLDMEARKRSISLLLINVFVFIQYIDLKYSWKMVGCVVERLSAADAHQESMFNIWNLMQNIIWCLQTIFLQQHIFHFNILKHFSILQERKIVMPYLKILFNLRYLPIWILYI